MLPNVSLNWNKLNAKVKERKKNRKRKKKNERNKKKRRESRNKIETNNEEECILKARWNVYDTSFVSTKNYETPITTYK